MPNRPTIHVRRYALYEEFVIPGDFQQPKPGFSPASASRRGDGLLPLVGRAAVAVGVTLLPLCAARLAGFAARRALGAAERPALPLPRARGRYQR